MKKLSTLKLIIDILYISAIIGLIVFLGFYLVVLFGWDLSDLPFKLKDYNNLSLSQNLYIIYPFLFLALLVYILVLKNFKKIIELFYQGKFFEFKTVKLLREIGLHFLISVFLMVMPSIITPFLSNTTVVKFSLPIGFDSSFFLIAIGLFFMALSEIFNKAFKINQENELTI
nr:DUF2975 domain-containing protein [uncultured Psychroserpens sp.]